MKKALKVLQIISIVVIVLWMLLIATRLVLFFNKDSLRFLIGPYTFFGGKEPTVETAKALLFICDMILAAITTGIVIAQIVLIKKIRKTEAVEVSEVKTTKPEKVKKEKPVKVKKEKLVKEKPVKEEKQQTTVSETVVTPVVEEAPVVKVADIPVHVHHEQRPATSEQNRSRVNSFLNSLK